MRNYSSVNKYLEELNMNDNQFWATFWIGLGLCLVLLVSVPVYLVQNAEVAKSAALKEMVAKGADPIKGACAMDLISHNSSICLANAK